MLALLLGLTAGRNGLLKPSLIPHFPSCFAFSIMRFCTHISQTLLNLPPFLLSTNVDPALISSITVEFVAVISFSVLLSRGLTTASRLTSRAWQFYLPDKLLRNQEFKVEISHLCLHRALTGFLLMAFMMLCTLTDFLNSSSLSISLLKLMCHTPSRLHSASLTHSFFLASPSKVALCHPLSPPSLLASDTIGLMTSLKTILTLLSSPHTRPTSPPHIFLPTTFVFLSLWSKPWMTLQFSPPPFPF
ncbi:hypothetical protein BGY98DRAFT_1061519 [Russula aff. rugulosa BPL654]|nr:hypothetical protein BGY98DRAFT_1061519 [Russula aff. rugulosa BPL654]